MNDKINNNSNSPSEAPKGGDSVSRDSSTQCPSDAVQAKPLEVKVHGNFDRALKAFRAQVQKERILSLYKEKKIYEKPSARRRRKNNEAKRNALTEHLKDSKSK